MHILGTLIPASRTAPGSLARVAMDVRERIPTIHELKLAGRVERARALFGRGGYLPQTLVGETAQTSPNKGVAVAGAGHQPPTPMGRKGIERPQGSCGELSSPKAKEDEHGHGVAPAKLRGDSRKVERDAPGTNADNAKIQLKPGASPLKREADTVSDALVPESLPPPPSNANGNVVTVVTLTIVGGGTGSRSFANLPQGSKKVRRIARVQPHQLTPLKPRVHVWGHTVGKSCGMIFAAVVS